MYDKIDYMIAKDLFSPKVIVYSKAKIGKRPFQYSLRKDFFDIRPGEFFQMYIFVI